MANGHGGKRSGAGKPKGAVHRRTKALRARILRSEALTAESTLEAIRRGQSYDIRRFFDKKGNLRPLHELTEEEAWAIAGFEIIVKNAAAGDGHTDTVHKIKLMDRSRYVEMAAKHHGLLTEKVEHSGGLSILHELPE
jgi:phage terminase small subunit